MKVNFILYVEDQDRAAAFYRAVLQMEPTLDVPGMTEFTLEGGAVLGLMPESGIKRLIGAVLPDPSRASGIPRAEVYLTVDAPEAYHQRALEFGALELSSFETRDWGDLAAYSLDLDGHVLVFAASSTLE